MPDEGGLLLLDTHVWVWLLEGRTDLLAPAATRRLEKASLRGDLVVSAISVWELATLESKGRIAFEPDIDEWVRAALAAPGVRLADLEPGISLDSARLPGVPPGDPADRILIATARRVGATLATADREILGYARKTRAVRVAKAGR